MSRRTLITNTLKDLGIPASLLGYKYITLAVEISIDDPECLRSTVKRLYPMIAKEFQVKWQNVERAIRTAIEICCVRGDNEKLISLFRNSYSACRGKPTNKEFIATLADYIDALCDEV